MSIVNTAAVSLGKPLASVPNMYILHSTDMGEIAVPLQHVFITLGLKLTVYSLPTILGSTVS